MKPKEAQKILRDAGFPIPVDGRWGLWSRRALREACRAFAFTQAQCGFKPPRAGGRLNPARVRMLRYIEKTGGKCSPNFSYIEFRCKGVTRGMHEPGDNFIRVSKRLIRRLEKFRRATGGPIAIISAGRSSRYNTAVGGATSSQHLYGWYKPYNRICTAVDINPRVPLKRAREVWGRGGIGYNIKSGFAAHLDIRTVSATWFYNR